MLHKEPGHFPTLTLRGKILALILAVTIGSLTVISVYNYAAVRADEREAAMRLLQIESERYADQVFQLFANMERDVRMMATTPAVARLGSPAASNSHLSHRETSEIARGQLVALYSTLLLARPHYFQVRLIGKSDNWREIVRVERKGQEIVTTPAAELQQKGDEPYIRRAMLPINTNSYFSQITLNREHHRDVGPPTIRIVQPLFDERNEVFGAVVINANFAELLKQAAPKVALNVKTTVVTGNLDYMTFGDGTEDPVFHYHANPSWTPISSLRALDTSEGSDTALHIDGKVIYVSEVGLSSPETPFSLYMVTEMQEQDLFAEANDRLRATGRLAIAIILATSLLSVVTASRLTAPLRELRQKLSTLGDGSDPIEIGALSRDEIGDLAGAFIAHSNDLLPAALRARAVFNSAGHAIVVMDENSHIEEVNEAAATLFGYEAQSIVGRSVSQLLNSDNPCGLTCFKCANPVACIDRDITGVHKDGREISLSVSLAKARYAGSNHTIAVMQDVTEQKLAEARVQELVRDLERSNAELDQFAYVASHDLKAPLRVIDNTSSWLEEDLADVLTDDTRESLQLLRSRVGRMTRLLDALLEHSRVGRVAVPKEQIPFCVMMEEIEDLLDEHKGFVIETDPALRHTLVNRLPLQTVLLNLVNNAIRHHDRDRGTVRIGFRDQGDFFEFIVEDDGPGIPVQFHQKVFQPFQTLKPRDQLDSSGVGLAMVRKYVDLVGGRIHLVSGNGRGCSFHVFWPKSDQVFSAPERMAS